MLWLFTKPCWNAPLIRLSWKSQAPWVSNFWLSKLGLCACFYSDKDTIYLIDHLVTFFLRKMWLVQTSIFKHILDFVWESDFHTESCLWALAKSFFLLFRQLATCSLRRYARIESSVSSRMWILSSLYDTVQSPMVGMAVHSSRRLLRRRHLPFHWQLK